MCRRFIAVCRRDFLLGEGPVNTILHGESVRSRHAIRCPSPSVAVDYLLYRIVRLRSLRIVGMFRKKLRNDSLILNRLQHFIVLLLTLIPGVLVCNHLCAVFVAESLGGFIQKPISKRLIFVSRLCLNLGCLNLGLGLLSIRGLLLLDKVFVAAAVLTSLPLRTLRIASRFSFALNPRKVSPVISFASKVPSG